MSQGGNGDLGIGTVRLDKKALATPSTEGIYFHDALEVGRRAVTSHHDPRPESLRHPQEAVSGWKADPAVIDEANSVGGIGHSTRAEIAPSPNKSVEMRAHDGLRFDDTNAVNGLSIIAHLEPPRKIGQPVAPTEVTGLSLRLNLV
jgi:hypothetical protein